MITPKARIWLERQDSTTGELTRITVILGSLFTAEMMIHFLSSLLETFLMGKNGPAYLSALTLSTSLIAFLGSFFYELGTGLTTMVTQRVGAGNFQGAARVLGQAILLCIVFAFPLVFVGIFFAPLLLSWLTSDPEVIRLGIPYLGVGLSAMIILAIPFIFNACFRATGHAAYAVEFELLQLLLLFILMPILVFGLGPIPQMGTLGAILALVITRLIILVCQTILISTRSSLIPFRFSSLKPDTDLIWGLIYLSLPSTGQQLVRYGADLFMLRLVAIIGTEAIAGYSIGIISIRFLDSIGQGFGNAVFTTVGQNLGARNPQRTVMAIWLGIRYSILASGICILLLVLIAPWLVQIFNQEPAVTSIAVIVTRILAVSYAFTAVSWAFIRSFNGAGNTILPMLVDVASLWFFQFISAYLLGWALNWQANGIWVAMAATCLIRAGLLFGSFQFSFKKHFFNKYMGQEAST